MAKEERQENLDEIKKMIEKSLKKNKELTQDEIAKLIQEANENVEFLKVLKEFNIESSGKRVIFVDGKACLVYDNGVFYIEDSMDSKKSKKKLTRNQATELYVEYFFRYIMNPAIEAKKMRNNIEKFAEKNKIKESKIKKKNEVKEEKKFEKVQERKIENKKSKEDFVR